VLFDGEPLHPLRDLWDAAVRHKSVKLTCTRCGHSASFPAAALWWHFHRRGWNDRFGPVRRRMVCSVCWYERANKVRRPVLDLVDEAPSELRLAMPSSQAWKRELGRRR
jgi:ribosomal protein L37E